MDAPEANPPRHRMSLMNTAQEGGATLWRRHRFHQPFLSGVPPAVRGVDALGACWGDPFRSWLVRRCSLRAC